LNFDIPNSLIIRNIVIINLVTLLLLPCLLAGVNAKIVINDPKFGAQIVTKGLSNPTGMVFLDRNQILVLEKDEGKVLRVVNGNISKDPVLALDVNHHKERGLLGIALLRNPNGDKENKENEPKYVFLFYTEPRYTGKGNAKCNKQECEEAQFNNRLYRYEYKNNKMINPKLLFDIPIYWNNRVFPAIYSEIIHGGKNWGSYPIREGVHQGGVLAVDHDDNLYLVTGDGGACHSAEGCYSSVNNGFLGAQTANKINGSLPVGMGGIIWLTEHGKPVKKNGILGAGKILDFYYAYGIRNSFGMDFDPVSGKLWDTENGPHFGDEINLVNPGFNSGWTKIQGVWPILNSTDLQDNATTKGHPISAISLSEKALENFGGKGVYRDPEFTWNSSVGVTSLKFLDTDKLGKQYRNDMFVGDALGRIYHFNLNENRNALELNGTLKDKIANSEAELKDSIFGEGFNTVTDLEVGPDGHLYVLSYSGTIYKIVHKDIGNSNKNTQQSSES
jgi:glucose/arabinose dehydrogenase